MAKIYVDLNIVEIFLVGGLGNVLWMNVSCLSTEKVFDLQLV